MKPNLIVNKLDYSGGALLSLGLYELLHYLVDSGIFNISWHNEKLSAQRNETSSILYYNNKKILIDVWEYPLPSYSEEVVKGNFNLIIKLQHPKLSFENFNISCNRKGFLKTISMEDKKTFYEKFVPWTFFCSRMMKQFIGKENKLEKLPEERLAFFCGKGWKCRRKMRFKLIQSGIEYIDSSQETYKPITDDDYIYKMRTSKYGLVLAGRGSWFTEAKNRREIDYMIFKKPLLLNYKPNYYDPLIEGKHFIYIDDKTDLNTIHEHYDINQIALNSFQWYQNNASPKGVVNSFMKIVVEKFN